MSKKSKGKLILSLTLGQLRQLRELGYLSKKGLKLLKDNEEQLEDEELIKETEETIKEAKKVFWI